MLALAFPNANVAGLAWIAPGVMLVAALGRSGAESFRLGYVAGLTFWLGSLYWLLLIPATGFPILGWAALAGYLGLFQGVWVWLCWRCFPATAAMQTAVRRHPDAGVREALQVFQAAPRLARLRWAILCAVSWVALEMLRARLLSGFPWSYLGVSQFQLTPLLQISTATGVYGVSFLVAWTSVSLLGAGLMLLQPQASRSALVGEVFLPFLTVAVIFATGYYHITHVPTPPREVRVTVVQPSIPQTMIWDTSADERRFVELLALTQNALSNDTDLLVWPEAAVPELNPDTYRAITNVAVAHRVWFIFGADDVQLRPGAVNDHDVMYFNAAWLLSPRGLMADTYHKRRLVMFGEYVPLARWLPFVKWLTPITGSYQAGTAPAQFFLRDLDVTASPLICFEDVFPHGVRDHVTEATDLLVNLTNDGWFGEGAEQWQHAANAVFRAVENGVPLVRACNNGLSCWVDPQGRMRSVLRDSHGTIYGRSFTTFNVALEPAPHRATFYHRHGDVFGWTCVAFTALAWLRRQFTRRRKS